MAKLMLVEDDNNLREIYEARLQAEGYTIVSARDGEEALVTAKTEKPDLIISDVMMPKISGFEMLDILRNTEEMKAVKVIMLTALGQSDDQERANHLGADRYLVKSQVTLEDIVKLAHELLNDTPAAAEPAAAPAPAEPATPAPAAKAAPASDSSDAVQAAAQSEAKEASDVQTKIEDFVAGASEEATAPADQVQTATAPAPAADPVVAAPPAADDDTAATDDTKAKKDDLIKEPATRLAESTNNEGNEPDEDSVAGRPTIIDADASAKTEKASSENVPINHKKVINPPAAEPKHDIEALLAEEEAKSGAVLPTTIVTGSDSKDDNKEKLDPRSVAL
jgi:DNA-binding response OmpR family regulator